MSRPAIPNLGTAEDQTGIAGQVTDNTNSSATGAYVYAYRNMRSSLRGPADFEAQVDKMATTFWTLSKGITIWLRVCVSPEPMPGHPSQVMPGRCLQETRYSLDPAEVTVINFILQGVAQPMLMREGTLTSGETGFSGQLVDSDDKPLPGAFVIAYPDSDFQRMPEATSPSVGDDGRFQLYVERPGQWCLAARTRTRGQPIAGEPYGKLGRAESGCRMAVTGKIIDVGTIRLTPYR